MLSAYEQERLDNIARNNAFLDAIGLGENKPALIPKKKVTKRCHDDADDDEASAEPTRRSARVAKIDPEHGQLTDEFCIAEERGLIRSKRARTEPAKAYSEIQAEEDAERREASLQRASAKRKALEDAERRRLQEKQRQTIAIQQANRIAMQQQRVNMPIVLPPAQLVASSVKPGARYPVKGETAVCATLLMGYSCSRSRNTALSNRNGCLPSSESTHASVSMPSCLLVSVCRLHKFLSHTKYATLEHGGFRNRLPSTVSRTSRDAVSVRPTHARPARARRPCGTSPRHGMARACVKEWSSYLLPFDLEFYSYRLRLRLDTQPLGMSYFAQG
jgi:hypothetical protein